MSKKASETLKIGIANHCVAYRHNTIKLHISIFQPLVIKSFVLQTFLFSIHKNISFLLHSTPWVAPSNVHTKSHIKDHSGSGFQDNSGVTSWLGAH